MIKLATYVINSKYVAMKVIKYNSLSLQYVL